MSDKERLAERIRYERNKFKMRKANLDKIARRKARMIADGTWEVYRIERNRKNKLRAEADKGKKKASRWRENYVAWWVRKTDSLYGEIRDKSKARSRSRAQAKRWAKSNPDRRRAIAMKYWNSRKQRPSIGIKSVVCTRLKQLVKGIRATSCYQKLLGCSVDEFKAHLESLFQPGMTWDNHSKEGWHIDHIKPCASFDLTDPKQLAECFHYTNQRPLWAFDNLSKGDLLPNGLRGRNIGLAKLSTCPPPIPAVCSPS
jgi:hypothetical protein